MVASIIFLNSNLFLLLRVTENWAYVFLATGLINYIYTVTAIVARGLVVKELAS